MIVDHFRLSIFSMMAAVPTRGIGGGMASMTYILIPSLKLRSSRAET